MEDRTARVSKIQQAFRALYNEEPRVFRAPGRVNLIGEHTDYNDGFVLPCALEMETLTAGRSRTDSQIHIRALDIGEEYSFDLRDEPVRKRGNWVDYVEGAIRCVQLPVPFEHGADLAFSSTVPIGGGLSSSAALEVSIGYTMAALAGAEIGAKELALAAQTAEHEFVGIRCGIMDQLASAAAKHGHALLIDCRSLETSHIPLELCSVLIAVCDTKVKHTLASSEYNKRRAECETGVGILKAFLPGIKSLRDISIEQFEAHSESLPETTRRRCRHVVSENERTLAAADALRSGDLAAFGMLMQSSHRSLRDDYEVSSPELDLLVETAGRIEGVLGARMTGGGFGGCTVNLVAAAAKERFRAVIAKTYLKRFGFEPAIHFVGAGAGAGVSEIVEAADR